jgi:23S rRNA (cytidine1920-2'-O)/16S rRNA (cytidine1409-2'-O)-methyltransferase
MDYTSGGEMQKATQRLHAPAAERKRLDRVLVERGLVETREKAQALILAGNVLVEGRKIEKAGTLVDAAAAIEILPPKSRYVGRGGMKLEAALAELRWDVQGLVCLDIGSSTGGFVDCLLQHGAARVIAVDVGTSQLDWRLRQDPRVRLLERTNARYLTWEQIGEKADLITMDVSFISATRILPALPQFAKPGARLLVLVKPQFEVGKGQVGKGGIVRDAALHEQAVAQVHECAASLGFADSRAFPCPILGAEGNQEFFLAAVYSKKGNSSEDAARARRAGKQE